MSEASPKGKGRTPVVIIAIAMDQGGLFKMRRQIAHKTTRKKCNLANPDYFAVTDYKTINAHHYTSAFVQYAG